MEQWRDILHVAQDGDSHLSGCESDDEGPAGQGMSSLPATGSVEVKIALHIMQMGISESHDHHS